MATASTISNLDELDDLDDLDDLDEDVEEYQDPLAAAPSGDSSTADSLISLDGDNLTREEEIKLATLIQQKPGGLSALNKKTRGLHKLCQTNSLYFGKSNTRRRKKFQNKVDRWKKLTKGEYLVVLNDLGVALSPPSSTASVPKVVATPAPAAPARTKPKAQPAQKNTTTVLPFSPIKTMTRPKATVKIPTSAGKFIS